MKHLSGSARAQLAAGVDETYRVVREVERYPDWHGDVVREVRVLARRAEGADRVAAVLRARLGPVDRDFDLVFAVRAQAEREVILERAPHEPGDEERMTVHWTLRPLPEGDGAGGCELALALDATLDVPRLVPLPGGLGDQLARGFLEGVARRLSR